MRGEGIEILKEKEKEKDRDRERKREKAKEYRESVRERERDEKIDVTLNKKCYARKAQTWGVA